MNPLRLSWLRLSRGGTGMRPVAAILAVTGATMVVLSSIGIQVQSSVVGQSLAGLEGSDRYLSASFDGADRQRAAVRDSALDSFDRLSGVGTPREYSVFRPMWDGSHSTYQLSGSSQLADEVTLDEGRLPTSCTAVRCEVVRIGSHDVSVRHLGLVVVGHARWRAQPALGRALDPTASVLVASDPRAVAAMPSMRNVPHSWLWASTIDTESVAREPHAWLDAASAAITRASLADARLVLAVPSAQVAQAIAQGESVRSRVQGLSLALALVAIAACGLVTRQNRERIMSAVRVARQYTPGARMAPAWDIALPVVIGRLLGASLGIAACAAARLPWAPLAAWEATGTAALACVAAGLAALSTRGTSRVALVALALLLGTATAAVLHVTPTVAVACLTGGTLGAAAVAVGVRSRGSSLRRSLTANNRSALVALGTVVAMSCASGAAAVTQGSMLDMNAVDHARFVSPLTVRVTALEATPLGAMTLDSYRQLGSQAYPIARLPATSRSGQLGAAPVQVLGLPAEVLRALPDVSRQTGQPMSAIASLAEDQVPPGSVLPQGSIDVSATGLAANVDVSVWLLADDGRFVSAPCVHVTRDGCTAEPPVSAGSRLVGVTLSEDPGNRARRDHAAGEGVHDVVAPHGTLRVTGVHVDAAPVDAGNLVGAVDYDLAAGPAYFAVSPPPRALRIIVDPLTAATGADGSVALRLGPGTVLDARAVAVARRFPTATPQFALVGLPALTAWLAATDPSLLTMSDVWLAEGVSADSLAQLRAAGVGVVTQDEVLRAVTSDAGHMWSTRAMVLAVLALLAVCTIIAAGTVGEIHRRTPARPWALIGISGTSYRRTSTWVVALTASCATLTAALVATPLAARVEQYLGLDSTGTAAVPPLAVSWPSVALSALVAGITLLTASISVASSGRHGDTP